MIQVQIMPGSIFPLGDNTFTPYPESQGGRLFGKKDNPNTLRPRYSGNSTPPTMNPLIATGSHKSFFHTYNLLTLRNFYICQRHIPRYWKWYVEPHQQG